MSNDEDIWLHALMIGFIPPVVGMIIIDLLVYNMGSGETNVSLLCFPVCWVLAFFYVSNHYNKKAELARKNT
jgi:positive regulator of sigma E activity